METIIFISSILFFEEKAIEHLLGAGTEGEDLNDDRIGTVMDKLYKYDGLTKLLFLIIALEVVEKYGVAINQIFPFRFNLIAFAWRV